MVLKKEAIHVMVSLTISSCRNTIAADRERAALRNLHPAKVRTATLGRPVGNHSFHGCIQPWSTKRRNT